MQDSNQNQHISRPPFPAAVNGGVGSSFKRLKHPQQLPFNLPPGHVVFRLLCHASRIGGVIGKSGSIIKQLQQETSAKIRIEDSFANSDDHRVIVIIGSASVIKKVVLLNASNRNPEKNYELKDVDGGLVEASAAQEAVVRVFERVILVAAESDGAAVMSAGGLVSCRLLAEANQVGSVIGKGGKVVEKIRKDTGCRIKVLTPQESQSCTYEMVEIEGDILAVKRALVAVTSCLQDCATSNEKGKMSGNRPFEAVPKPTLPNTHLDFSPQPMSESPSSYALGGRPLSVEGDRTSPLESRSSQLDLVFKILCLSDKVGAVIGKGGSIVKTLQVETGAFISVGPTIPHCDERLITITASENLDSRHSAAQNGLLRVFDKFMDAGPEKGVNLGSGTHVITLRLVVPSNQVGCLLGKGGCIISEIRKTTRTSIWIISGDQLPKCVTGNDEVVQIMGELGNVRNALCNVTRRLRDQVRTTKMHLSFKNDRIRDSSQLGFHPPIGAPQSLNQHNTLTQSMENLGISQSVDRPPSPRLQTSQVVLGANQRGVTEGKGLTSVKSCLEFGSGSRSAIVTNTTVEIVVPETVIGSVYGENGCNLIRLRQISGAKVMVHEPLPGTTDRIVIISGSPDETQAAQSLLQAFILTGSS